MDEFDNIDLLVDKLFGDALQSFYLFLNIKIVISSDGGMLSAYPIK